MRASIRNFLISHVQGCDAQIDENKIKELFAKPSECNVSVHVPITLRYPKMYNYINVLQNSGVDKYQMNTMIIDPRDLRTFSRTTSSAKVRADLKTQCSDPNLRLQTIMSGAQAFVPENFTKKYFSVHGGYSWIINLFVHIISI